MAARPSARFLLATAALLLAVFLVLHPGLFRGEVPVPADISWELAGWRGLRPEEMVGPRNGLLSDPAFAFYPWRLLTTEQLRHGEVPLWNRFNGLGVPLLGNFQSAPFDPFSLPWFALPAPWAWTAQLLLRSLTAGVLAAALALHLGAGRAGALLAALAYGAGGYVATMLDWPNSSGAAWLPGQLLAADLLARGPTLRRAALLAVTIALAVLSGHPEVLAVTQTAAALWFLARVAGPGLAAGTRLRALLLGAGAAIAALLLTAPVLFPAIEFLLRTDRFQVFAQQPIAVEACFPAAAWPAFLCPRLFDGPEGYRGPLNLVLTRTLFSGLVPLLLGAAALVSPSTRRAAAPLAAWGVLHLLVAFDSPVHDFLGRLPTLRVAALNHFTLPGTLAVSLLGALGLTAVLRPEGRAWLAPLLATAAAWVALAPLALPEPAMVRVALPCAALTVVLVFALLARRLWLAMKSYRGTVPPERVFPEREWTRAIREADAASPADGPYRALALPAVPGVSFTGVLPNALIAYGIEDAAVFDPMHTADYRRLLALTGNTGPLHYLRPDEARPHLLDLLGVRWLLQPEGTPPRDLLFHLARSGLRSALEPSSVAAGALEVAGERRAALLQEAPSGIDLSLPASRAPRRLSFALALDPAVWSKPGDGIEFQVLAAAEESAEVVACRRLDPRSVPGDRAWIGLEADLSRFAGRTVQLTLRATSGPSGDNAFDFAVWGSPRVGPVGRLPPAALLQFPRRAGGDRYVAAADLAIAGRSQPVLFTHADSEVEFPADVPADDPFFRAEIALDPVAWTAEGGDGVLFEVLARPAARLEPVLVRRVDPAREAGDRRWLPVEVDLAAFGTAPLRLRFAALPGPAGDAANDRGAWGGLALSPPLEETVARSDALVVLRRPSPLPRAFVVHRWLAGQPEDLEWAQLASGSPDFRRVALLSGEGVAAAPEGPAPPPGEPAVVRERGHGRVVVEAEAREPGYLVLLEAWDPGWEATVDGRAAPVLRANRLFRAVPLPAGRHTVELRYRPRGFRTGLWLALAGAALLAAAWGKGVRTLFRGGKGS
jgi:hypothetical protein